MKNIRLLPVVVMAIAALLVLKTLGLATNGGYVLTGVTVARAAGGGSSPAPEGGDGELPGDHVIEDTAPTLTDTAPTLAPQTAPEHGAAPSSGDHGAPATDHGDEAEHAAAARTPKPVECVVADATIRQDGTVVMAATARASGGGHGGGDAAEGEAPKGEHAEAAPAESFASSMTDCLPTGDAIPLLIDGKGGSVPLLSSDGSTATEQALLERLASRRTDLEKYEQDLALRSSIVAAAEKRIEERAATLEALEAQISGLVDQRQEMESGQFAGIVALYEGMKPKDAATIFNSLEMEVLLRVAKQMNPRKMSPILAAMSPTRAQELTVRMAALADRPATEMTQDDVAALPQIVGQ